MVDSIDRKEIINKYHNSLNSYYCNALNINSIEIWEDYIRSVPPEDIRDAEEKMHNSLKEKYTNKVCAVVISFPYREQTYSVTAENNKLGFTRVKQCKITKANFSDSIYLPYGEYNFSISAPNTDIIRYTSSELINKPKMYIPLSVQSFTINKGY